jgi:hypothetical protein
VPDSVLWFQLRAFVFQSIHAQNSAMKSNDTTAEEQGNSKFGEVHLIISNSWQEICTENSKRQIQVKKYNLLLI